MPQEQQFSPGYTQRDTSGQLWKLVEYDENGEGQWTKVVEEGGGGREKPSGRGREKVPLGFLRTAAQGATLGFSDELAGLLKGFTPGGPKGFKAGYKEGVEGERGKLHAYREQNPLGAIGAEALGGLGTGFGLAGGARAIGARVLPKAVGLAGKAKPGLVGKVTPGAGQRSVQATRAAQVAEEGGGLAGRMLGSAGIGAAEGAVYGVGVGEENLKSRATSGLLGAGMGAVAAPVMTAGVAGLGAGKGFVGDVWRGHAGKIGAKSRQIKTDEMLTKSFIQQAPQKARLRGDQWVQEMEDIVSAGPKARNPVTGQYVTAAQKKEAREALKDMAESGDARNYAAIRGAAADAAAREAVPGSVPRMLGDATDDFAETTAQVARQGGDEVEDLKGLLGAGTRADPVSGSLDDLKKVAHADDIGSASKRLEDLGESRKTQAAQDYGNFYDLDAADWAKIIDDPTGLPGSPRKRKAAGLQAVIADVRAATKSPAAMEVLEEAFKDPSAASSFQKSFRGGKGPRPKGTDDLTLDQILKNPQAADARDVDTLYRALKLAQTDALPRDGRLSNILGKVAAELDNSVAKHSDKYLTARGNYRVKSRKLDAYENGTKNYGTPDELKYAHDNAWKVARDQGRNLTAAQKKEIQKEFRQARIDTIADKARGMADDAAAADYIEKQFKMLFDGPNAPFAGAGGTTKQQRKVQEKLLERVRTNLKSRSSQAATGKRVEAHKGTGQLKEASEVSGAVPATAGLYGLAGQFGAMGRTAVASLIYGKGQQRKYAQALAKRLKQEESRGLLDMAETMKGTERRRLAGLLAERGTAAGGAAATQGFITADVLGGGLLGEQRYR